MTPATLKLGFGLVIAGAVVLLLTSESKAAPPAPAPQPSPPAPAPPPGFQAPGGVTGIPNGGGGTSISGDTGPETVNGGGVINAGPNVLPGDWQPDTNPFFDEGNVH